MKRFALSLLLPALVAATLCLHCSAAPDPARPAGNATDAAKPAETPKAAEAKPSTAIDVSKLIVDEKKLTVTVPAVVADRSKPADGAPPAPLSCLLVAKGGKTAESLFVTECSIDDLRAALVKLRAKAGKPATDNKPPTGTGVNVFVEYTLEGQPPVRRPVDELLVFPGIGRALKALPWTFTGSVEVDDPATKTKTLQANLTQTIIGLYWTDPSPLLQNPRPEAAKAGAYDAGAKEMPPAGTAVRLVLEPQVPVVPEGTRRSHVFISGRVQGVGYRDWTVGQANRLGLKGWVRNLADGRVEAVVEGPQDKVADLLKRMETGPAPAKVDKVEASDETPEGDFARFTRLN
jgi:acylphosphatase